MLAVRKRPTAKLRLPDGSTVALKESTVLIGRKVTPEGGAQAISVIDSTRTISKRHAKLEHADGKWFIEDLDSTNGIVLLIDGGEVEVTGRIEVHGRFLLGDAELELIEES